MAPIRQIRMSHQSNPDLCSEQHPLDEAFARNTVPSSIQWLSTCAAFADSGGIASRDELPQRLVDSTADADRESGLEVISLVARWITARAVVAVLGPSGWMLPMFQFDLATGTLKPSMAPVLAELYGVFDEAQLALWFVSPNNWIGGNRPAMVMHKYLPAVLHAARSDRYVTSSH